MTIEDRKMITMSRQELVEAILQAVDLPKDTIVNHFSVRDTTTEDAVVMSVTVETRTA